MANGKWQMVNGKGQGQTAEREWQMANGRSACGRAVYQSTSHRVAFSGLLKAAPASRKHTVVGRPCVCPTARRTAG
jgi:hypothetical protein